ncbi:hypothetical protein DUNSADRAFT_13558 [Dunaliella salina]|uniref:Uncharacterized protein n=1 Tax=Dunaliella salina TaxID=3046 RepID=A0ABQ7H347_DUNSA|nr:hypothetical protein DUNSADRAFT_13558 [Dunaliella salina]|eukprot:KAF5841285.1 hypothetical protein DUNSADRAFT_13558 [Dunaliella salina]
MGTSHSSPVDEKIWKAANANRPIELARHITALQSNPNGWNRGALEWKDKLGRTPLIVCARENRTACAQVLLQAGADVHYVNCAADGHGSALHEAAHRDADEMVVLLLRYGASPWVANK